MYFSTNYKGISCFCRKLVEKEGANVALDSRNFSLKNHLNDISENINGPQTKLKIMSVFKIIHYMQPFCLGTYFHMLMF